MLGDDPDALVHDLQDRFPKAQLLGGDKDFEHLVARVVGFVEAPALGLDLPLDVQGTAFQQRVWQALRAIPSGTTASYAEIAERIGAPQAVRAVAQACASNTIAVAIPCHRVVRQDGALAGYRWGVERKQALPSVRPSHDRCRCLPRAMCPCPTIAERVATFDWQRIAAGLDAHGCAVVGTVLSPAECQVLAESYAEEGPFRSRIVMARHGFGRGEYKYFAYPLPTVVASLRHALYPPLASIANRWNETLGIDVRYPDAHAVFLERCHGAGQTRPTPLLLHYGEDDYNCLHQISMASMSSRCKSPSSCRCRDTTSRAVNSCSRSSDLASNRALKWCRSGRETASSSRSIIGQCKARKDGIASTCAMA